jgi:hypothetical protein
MNLEMGPEAAQFPEKEYINVIFVAVYYVELKVPFLNFGLDYLIRVQVLSRFIQNPSNYLLLRQAGCICTNLNLFL